MDGEWQDITSVASLKGEKGANGKDGANGSNGSNGTNGVNGIDGKNGLNGAQGIQGQKGDRGDQGIKSEKGGRGLQGAEGLGIPQTLSLNNGILPLSHNGGSVTLPQLILVKIVSLNSIMMECFLQEVLVKKYLMTIETI